MSDRTGEFPAKWGFKQDPFSEKYPYEEGFWALPTRDIEILKYLLGMTIKQNEVLDVLVQGQYGSGKTYSLQYLGSYIERKLGGVGVYFQIQPKYQLRGFIDIFTEIMRAVGSGRIVRVGNKIRDEMKIKQPKDFENFLEPKITNHDFIKAVSNLTFNNEFVLTWLWLKGEATIYQQRSLGLEESPKDETIGLEVLTSLTDYLLLSYPIVGFCVDELENLTGQSLAIRSIREGIRNFLDRLVYDKKKRRVAVISSVTAEAMYQLEFTLGTPLLNRIDRNVILKDLSEAEAAFFVERLFAFGRGDGKTDLCPPFKDQETFKEFLTRAKVTTVIPNIGKPGSLTPRKLIKLGKYLLQTACFDEQDILNAAYTSKILA